MDFEKRRDMKVALFELPVPSGLQTLAMEHLPEANIEVLKSAFSYLNAANIGGCLSLMRPDFIINLAEMPFQKRGHKAWRSHAEYLFTALPDVKVHIDDIFAADDKVAVRVRIKGTHLGEFLGSAPTGKVIEYTSHEVYRFEGGLLAEEWICSDNLTLMMQVGALSQTRLVSMWLASSRFWFGVATGVGVAVVLNKLYAVYKV